MSSMVGSKALTRGCQPKSPRRDEVVVRIKRFHKQIAAAILGGDQALAQARMLRYVGGIKAWLK